MSSNFPTTGIQQTEGWTNRYYKTYSQTTIKKRMLQIKKCQGHNNQVQVPGLGHGLDKSAARDTMWWLVKSEHGWTCVVHGHKLLVGPSSGSEVFGEDVEKRELSCTLGGNAKWYSHCRRLYGGFSNNWKQRGAWQAHSACSSQS